MRVESGYYRARSDRKWEGKFSSSFSLVVITKREEREICDNLLCAAFNLIIVIIIRSRILELENMKIEFIACVLFMACDGSKG
jgi:hypothetical protein